MPTPLGFYRWTSFEEQLDYYTYKDPNSGCWIWTGALSTGYAMAINKDFGKERRVHRMSYKFFVGEIPPSMMLDHICRVRCCVNPAHLEPVTFLENIRRGLPFKRPVSSLRDTCKRGHKYTPENTYVEIDSDGYNIRHCLTCKKLRAKGLSL